MIYIYILYIYNIWAFPPRLAILCILRAVAGDFAAHFGIKCASFSKMNVGTSLRSACATLGCTAFKSVHESNRLLERTADLCGCNQNLNTYARMGFDISFHYGCQLPNHDCSHQDLPSHFAGDGPWRDMVVGTARWKCHDVLPDLSLYASEHSKLWWPLQCPRLSDQSIGHVISIILCWKCS